MHYMLCNFHKEYKVIKVSYPYNMHNGTSDKTRKMRYTNTHVTFVSLAGNLYIAKP